jgi:hypothetical protein
LLYSKYLYARIKLVMLMRLCQAIAITFLLHLIMGMDKLTAVQPSPVVITPRQSIGLKAVPQPVLNPGKPRL